MPRCSSKLLLVATCASLCGATPALLASPKDWIRQLDALNAMPVAGNAVDTKAAYLNFLSSVLTSSMHDIDGWAAYFQKRREVTLQRDLYLRCVQTKDYAPLQPTPKLTPADYHHLLNVYTRYANHSHSHRRQRNSQDFHHGMRAFGPWRPG